MSTTTHVAPPITASASPTPQMPAIPTYTLPSQFQAPATRPPGLTPFSLNECFVLYAAMDIYEIVQAQMSDATYYPDEITSDWNQNAVNSAKWISATRNAESGLAKVGVPKNSLLMQEIDAYVAGPLTEWQTQSNGPRDLTTLPMIYAEMRAYYTKVGQDCDAYSSDHG